MSWKWFAMNIKQLKALHSFVGNFQNVNVFISSFKISSGIGNSPTLLDFVCLIFLQDTEYYGSELSQVLCCDVLKWYIYYTSIYFLRRRGRLTLILMVSTIRNNFSIFLTLSLPFFVTSPFPSSLLTLLNLGLKWV